MYKVTRYKVQSRKMKGTVMRNEVNRALVAKKKKYNSAKVEILRIEPTTMMIPGTGPLEPTPAPQRNWRPGPGASYQPPAKIV